jgi:hypothetical protein
MIRRIMVQSQPQQMVHDTLSRKTLSQTIGLVERLKVKAPSASPSTEKKECVIDSFQFNERFLYTH